MLTHHTLVTAVASLQGFVDLGNIRMGPDDSFLSFLTLAHIFDRVVEEFMLSVGGHIGYWQVRKRKENKRNEKTTPFGVIFMRSQVLYRAAQATGRYKATRFVMLS